MRPIWTGAIGFGLVNIPVKLYSATQSSTLDLDMLDKKDHSHIRFKRVNEQTGKEVKWEDIVKGYKYNDQYVVLTDKDFEAASAKKTKVIEISDFIKEGEINTMYYETPYYLEPDKSGVRAYALLREALRKTGKIGVATFVMRNKESLAMIKPLDKVLVLHRARFGEEIRDYNELNLPGKAEVKANELQMAIALIDQQSRKFDIASYRDSYTDTLMDIIRSKAKGKGPAKTPRMKVVHSQPQDLMEQLKASLNRKQHKKAS
ncbi:MAG: Ku protein [Bacteroidota bacterium]